MSPILGIIASGIQNSIANANSYESIATVSVGSGGSSSISFTSIPSTYQHLQVRFLSKDGTGATTANVFYALNSDTTNTNYRAHYLYGDGGTAGAGNEQTRVVSFSAGNTSSQFGVGVLDVLDYANTNKNTTTRALSGADANGSGLIVFSSSLWVNTSAVTTITMYPNSGNFAQYSSFALYGIKG